ncbi:hypothetical protein SAMN03097699_1600 [Flavobacteriaceae bacterium MAR_2010_188]|nr:hypothetical protein SAMN03097699_1600 [Flavobacteriaceae bacterium MAR_2010_188]
MNIKSWVLYAFLISSSIGFSQSETPVSDENENGNWDDDHYANFTVGLYYPIAFGDNFSSKALKHEPGFEINGFVNLGESKLLLGLHYNQFSADVSQISLIGDYDRTRVTGIGPMLGYHLIRTKDWRIILSAGGGAVRYLNYKGTKQFSDSGTSFWVNPSIQYHVNKTLGAYFSTTYRYDRMQIEAPEEYRDFFKSAKYLNLSLGLSIVF